MTIEQARARQVAYQRMVPLRSMNIFEVLILTNFVHGRRELYCAWIEPDNAKNRCQIKVGPYPTMYLIMPEYSWMCIDCDGEVFID